MTDITVFGQVRRRRVFAVGGYHLVQGAALVELRVALLAELTRTAGTGVESLNYGWIDVFHNENFPLTAMGLSPLHSSQHSLRTTRLSHLDPALLYHRGEVGSSASEVKGRIRMGKTDSK